MYKAFRNSAIALTLMGGVALFAGPASANPITKHQILLGDSSKPVGLTDVGWRRHYRYWGPPPSTGMAPTRMAGLLRAWTVLLSWACLRSRHLLVGLKQAQFELQGAAAGVR